ncbi:hypothetical protein BJ085DRAFT_32928 [Dimargaris cristalligena]|uniref:Glutamine synthetase C-terminal domain-containing protein n=1 Tax=Dimargaris cristalligena TaxID=215637 RepID=A0A4P9ZYM6_9FUNG|nr:hypothetical protein BJ085DRAFT_32928 [Dimargaris cristalligena]|eukprot:RKP38777.1 hypothetical protein BJ085DRAFT_32928 [Dimargaris cristalligena]
MMERYEKDMTVEAKTLTDMVRTQVMPAVFEYRRLLGESAIALKAVSVEPASEVELLERMNVLLASLRKDLERLEAAIEHMEASAHDQLASAFIAHDEVYPLMDVVRTSVDSLEEIVGDKFWTLPKYTELLLTI